MQNFIGAWAPPNLYLASPLRSSKMPVNLISSIAMFDKVPSSFFEVTGGDFEIPYWFNILQKEKEVLYRERAMKQRKREKRL